jgi:hypothetical protein
LTKRARRSNWRTSSCARAVHSASGAMRGPPAQRATSGGFDTCLFQFTKTSLPRRRTGRTGACRGAAVLFSHSNEP